MFSLFVALTGFAHAQSWEPTTLTLPNTIHGIDIQTVERDGWIRRIARGSHPQAEFEGTAYADEAYPALEGAAAPPSSSGRVRSEKRRAPSKAKGGSVVRAGAETVANQPALKAGTTDDNAHFGEFLEFLATWKDKPGMAGNHVEMDVSHRSRIQVSGANGLPLPGAQVTVHQGQRVVWSGTTYGDGEAPFYPGLVDTKDGDFQVHVQHGGVASKASWNGKDPIFLTLDDSAAKTVDLDVVFVIDTTGSMSDEIDRIKATLLTVTAKVQKMDRPVNLRYGAVLYRDIGDEYLTQHTALTTDLKAFDTKLQEITAGGGGDGPESLNQGLAVAVGEMDWRDDAAKLVFLVADAQPHMDYENDVTYARVSEAALSQGIRIHTVAASGLQDFGSLVFRQTAQLTRGQFIFIEYGSTAASAADHGVTGPVSSNNLDAILLEQITREVEGWAQPLLASR